VTTTACSDRWSLTLYVKGASPISVHAIETVRRICDEELGGHVDLEVIDVERQPAVGVRDQIIVVPTLVKRHPGPLRRIVGDLADSASLRLRLDLRPADVSDVHSGPGS
jgi:circadian clock protein KaiB